MRGDICPRCGTVKIPRNSIISLFFSVRICYTCAEEEVNRVKRSWAVHPEMAELYQLHFDTANDRDVLD